MPEEPEVETQELQETLDELHEERREREEAEKRNAWTRYIALSTACLAVFAAIGAMLSGSLVNEAMIQQIKAADTWNEYQADSLKAHTYTIATNQLLDAGAVLPPAAKSKEGKGEAAADPAGPKADKPGRHSEKRAEHSEKPAPSPKKPKAALAAMTDASRAGFYRDQIDYENEKKKELANKATELEHESEELMHHHHRFALSVAFIQVAIALSAIAALTRMKPLWGASMVVGLVGIGYFAWGLA